MWERQPEDCVRSKTVVVKSENLRASADSLAVVTSSVSSVCVGANVFIKKNDMACDGETKEDRVSRLRKRYEIRKSVPGPLPPPLLNVLTLPSDVAKWKPLKVPSHLSSKAPPAAVGSQPSLTLPLPEVGYNYNVVVLFNILIFERAV